MNRGMTVRGGIAIRHPAAGSRGTAAVLLIIAIVVHELQKQYLLDLNILDLYLNK